MEQKKQDRKEKMLDLSYWCWWRRKLWFKNNPDSFWDRKFSNVIGWKKFTTFQVSMLRLFNNGKKTYQLPGNSRNRGRIRVGELYKNSWRSFSFVSFIKKFFTEEQIKAHDDFFARRYNNATWKIFTRTVNKLSGWFSCSDPWWSKDMTLEFLTN